MTELNEHSDSLVPRSRQIDPARARSLVNLAREAEQRGDVLRSLRFYDDALALLADERDLPLLADTLRWKGTIHREQGETELAYRYYKQSLIHAETCGSIAGRAHGYNCLAIIAQRRGNLAECERLYAQASELAADAGDVRLVGMIEQNRGVLLNMRGDFVAAEARYSRSLGAFERANDDEAVSWVLNNIGMLYTKLGHTSAQSRLLSEASPSRKRAPMRSWRAYSRSTWPRCGLPSGSSIKQRMRAGFPSTARVAAVTTRLSPAR